MRASVLRTSAILGLLVAVWGCEELPRDGALPGQADFEEGFESQLSPGDQAQVLARVNETTITLGDFERRIEAQPPYARARYVASPERQKEFLDNLIRFEILAEEARRRGYDRHPEVVQAMKQTMVRKMMSRDVQDLVRLSDISEAEMKAYYEANRADYHKPEQVRISHILLADEATAQRVLASLRTQLAAEPRNYRKIFGDAVRAESRDAASKESGGDLRFFARSEEGGEQPKALSDAAFALAQVGDLGGPVQTEAGWHILLLTGRKSRYERTFDQVRRQIQNRLYRDKKRVATESFVEGLRTAARVERRDDLLTRIKPRAVTPPAPAEEAGDEGEESAAPAAREALGRPAALSLPGGPPRPAADLRAPRPEAPPAAADGPKP